MYRLSTEESKKIADLYQEILNENMDTGSIFGTAGNVTDLASPNYDAYAPGDNRIPHVLGTQTRDKNLDPKTKKFKCKKCKGSKKCKCNSKPIK